MEPVTKYTWHSTVKIPANRYSCGYCGENVSPDRGYHTSNGAGSFPRIYVCHVCSGPTLITEERQVPGAPYGDEVAHVPNQIEPLYQQARACMAVSGYTATVLLCRKILMNVAVNLGAEPNLTFVKYVKYLADQHYVPPNAKGWVDHIRVKGNEANHEIHLMSKTDAEELISLTEMMLKIIYEFPNRVPSIPPTPASSSST